MAIDAIGDVVRPFDGDRSPASIDAARRLSASLIGVVRVLEQTREQFADSIGVTTTEVRALGRIAEFGPITPKELATRLMLTTGTITPLLDSLVCAGLVEREPNPADRRSVHIRLTDLGHHEMSGVYGDLHARVLRAIAAKSDDEAQKLASCLDDVIVVLGEFTGLPPAKKP